MIDRPRPYSRRMLLRGAGSALALTVVPTFDAFVTQAADPAVATFTDAEKRITLQYPGDWMTRDVDATNGELLRLQGPGITVYLDHYSPSMSLEGDLAYQRDEKLKDGQYLRVFGDPVVGQIGGEAAGGDRYRYTERANPANTGVVTTWLVDHGGTRFRFYFDDGSDRHNADINAIIASVMFTPISLTTFTDPKGIFTFQYPQYWQASKSTGADADVNVLQLDADGLRVYASILDRTASLDGAIADYRTRYTDMPEQYNLVFDPPRDILIGGKPGRSIAVTSTEKAHPDLEPYVRTTYFVDHAGQRLRFETGNFGGAHVGEILAMMQSVTLLPQPYAVFTDTDHRITFQYPQIWNAAPAESPGAGIFTNIVLTGKNLRVTFLGEIPNTGIENSVQYLSDSAHMGDPATTSMVLDEARMDDRVGNESARVLTYRYRNPDGGMGTKKTWVVDHGGRRYSFQCSNYEVNTPEIDDLLASVAFAPVPLTTFTGPQGRITLQYPAEWTVVPPPAGTSTSTSTLLRATLKYSDTLSYVNLTVSEFRSAASLDDELAAFRDRTVQGSPDYDFAFDPPEDSRIGGEPARTMAYRPLLKGTMGIPANYRVWVLDHGGYRYGITFGDAVIHGAEIAAVLDSVRFM